MLEELQAKLKSGSLIRFKVKIIAKSKHNEIVGVLGPDILKIKVAAVAEKNKANSQLVKYLSDVFNVSKSNISIISGPTSPLKIIQIEP